MAPVTPRAPTVAPMSFQGSKTEQLLLKLCSACLSEISQLRGEVREVAGRGNAENSALQSGALGGEASSEHIETVSPSSVSLLGFIALEDDGLRELFWKSLQSGSLAVPLEDLATAFNQEDSRPLLPLLLAEMHCDAIRVVVLRNGKHLVDMSEKETAVKVVLEAMQEPQEQESNQDISSNICIAVLPRFKCLHWQVLKVLLQIASNHGVDPALDLLVHLVTELVKPGWKNDLIDDIAILRLLGNTMPRLCTKVYVSLQGRVHVAYIPEWAANKAPTAAPLQSEQLDELVDSLMPCTAALEAICSGSRNASLQVAPCILLGLLGVLRLPGCIQAAGLPKDFGKGLHTPTLVSAVERLLTESPTTKGAAPNPSSPAEDPETNVAIITRWHDHNGPNYSKGPGLSLLASTTQTNLVEDTTTKVSSVGKDTTDTAVDTSRKASTAIGGGAPNTASSPDVPTAKVSEANADGVEAVDPYENHGMVAEVAEEAKHGEQSASSSEDDFDCQDKLYVRFIECFKDDLEQDRQLLMSQINNLYRMRNNGKTLPYKRAGFDKLHDFLIQIPGLNLQGTGNRMQLRLIDRARFEAFCQQTMHGRGDYFIQKPQPIPQSFLHRLIDLFRRVGCREILVRNFRDSWNRHFPGEKLQCKELGYRDIKGLLANVSLIEKVGTRTNMKYVLKADVAPEIPSNCFDTTVMTMTTAPAMTMGIPREPIPMGALPGMTCAPLRMQGTMPIQSLADPSSRQEDLQKRGHSQDHPHTMALNLQESIAGPRGTYMSSMNPGLLLMARRTPTGPQGPVDVEPASTKLVERQSFMPARAPVPIGFGRQPEGAPRQSLSCKSGPMQSSTEPIDHLPPDLANEENIEDTCKPEQELLMAAQEHRRMRRLKKQNLKPRDPNAFITSPAAFTSEDRDASKEQGRFDLGTIYKARLKDDRYCMIVDLASVRVLFSSQLCETLFEQLSPLQDRDVADIIHEDDRSSFASLLAYLTLGKFSGMEPQVVKISTAHGMQTALISGEQLVGCWWYMDLQPEMGSSTFMPVKGTVPCPASPCIAHPVTTDHRAASCASAISLLPPDTPPFFL